MKYEYLSDIVAQVRKAPKALPYTVTLIKDIHQYGLDKEAKELEYQILREAKHIKLKALATKMVEEQMSVLTFSKAEKEEVTTLKRKQARDSILTAVISSSYGGLQNPPAMPKLTIRQRVKLFCIQTLKTLLVKVCKHL